ncbi:MAG: DUF2336 domain-containing protein [Rickettsiales bacterium]
MNITREDIQLLVREPSAAMRGRIAQKISTGYNSGLFSEGEVRLANEIFRLLLKDTEIKVRKIIAEELKNNLQVPHDIVLTMAHDHVDVAVPVLQHSYVLTEDDLVAIVHATREHAKLKAIASRESVSKELSHALVERRDPDIARQLLANRNASLAETSIETVIEEFARDNRVLEEMVYRGGLPYTFAEKLFSKVSDNLKKQLSKKYRMGKHVVDDVSSRARETATLQFISPWMSQQEISKLIDQMHRNKRLTDSVIIRSLCIGDLRFFETALSKRVGVPVNNARILLLDPGPLGFKALYDSSQLPETFYPAVRTMLQLALQETEYGKYRTMDFGARMVERITDAGYDHSIEHMSTLMTMIGRAIHERPTLH